ncbi:thioesterase family protein [Bacillus sp. Marseille-Q1617]|uniref:acyl-CoA thioesterase n=1 Tax=Bacillus sp. Marseille-Q1617 TaxID=2736887 RepID=UPI0015891A5A|nr:thioesterase family protein [Bacillus sp. Marseille-Q1617]
MHISENTVQVRYAETDQMGVVYHANYLVWMELGRTKLIEDLGFNYAEIEKDGILSPVVDLNISYKTPVRYGEKALVKTWVEDYDGIRITYAYEIYNGEGLLAISGQSKHVCVKKESFRPISIRRMFPDWHEAYEKAKREKN